MTKRPGASKRIERDSYFGISSCGLLGQRAGAVRLFWGSRAAFAYQGAAAMAKTASHVVTSSAWAALGVGPALVELETVGAAVVVLASSDAPGEEDPGHILNSTEGREFNTALPLWARGLPGRGTVTLIVTPITESSVGGGVVAGIAADRTEFIYNPDGRLYQIIKKFGGNVIETQTLDYAANGDLLSIVKA